MSSISFQFDRPWFFLILLPLLALILLPFFRLPAKRRRNFKKIAPLVLHCIIATLLIIILSGFSIEKTSYNQQLIILMDLSDSTESFHDEILAKAAKLRSLVGSKAVTGVVAFAGDSICQVALGGKNDIEIIPVDSDATNLAAALSFADSLMSDSSASRIILLSDGRQTEGNAAELAYYLNGHGTRIDSVYFDTTDIDSVEMQISSFSCTEGHYVGDEISIAAEIRSNSKGSAKLKLYDNEELIDTRYLTINDEITDTMFSFTPETAGVHSFKAVLEPEADTIPENNTTYCFASVAGEPSLLIICDRMEESELLAQLLSDDFSVHAVTSENAPDSIIKLCNYDEIILMNVNNDDLPEGFDALTRAYVEDYGRSLLAVGGRETFTYGNMCGTGIEEVLPVNFELKEAGEGPSVAIMLVIDCSGSMANQNFMILAKQGAISCVETLTENDYVGLVSFCRTANLDQPLVQATEVNKELLYRTISGLRTNQGTRYTTALNLANSELIKSTADVKYVMFVSDGEPNDSGYMSAINKLNNSGITLSTISIGYSSEVLSQMADAGGGRYYSVTTASDLPEIMLSETEQVTVNSYIAGNFRVRIAKPGSITEGITQDNLPVMKGYIGLTLKDGATSYLTTQEGRPIYAEWKYGAGTAAVFASDLSAAWCSNWFEFSASREVIKRIVASTLSNTHKESIMNVSCRSDGKTVYTAVSTGPDNSGDIIRLAVTDGTETAVTELTRTASGMYEGSFTAGHPGLYSIIASHEDAEGNMIDYVSAAYAASYSGEYDAFSPAGKSLLDTLVSYSGGRVTSDLAYLSEVKMANAVTATNPFIPLAVISTLLFLADVAIRKIRWKDFIAVFRRK